MATYGYLAHFGILGQKWGIRRYQNPDGSLTEEGRRRYGVGSYRRENNPNKTLNELKNIHEAEKQGNLKGVYDKYFSKDEKARSISKDSLDLARMGKALDTETDKALQKTLGDKTFINDVVEDCAKNIVEENHSEGGGGKYIYSDDIYDYVVNAYVNVLKRRNPNLDRLEKAYNEKEKVYKQRLEEYTDKIVGDLASEVVYTEKDPIFGFETKPRFVNEVRSLIANSQPKNIEDIIHYGSIKNLVDNEELAYDTFYNSSKEIENALKEKGMRVIW